MALVSISRVDDIVFSALSSSRFIVTKPAKQLEITVHKRNWEGVNSHTEFYWSADELERVERTNTCGRKLHRFVFKILRVFHVSWGYYFMPYSILLIPYLAELSRLEK